MVGSDLEGEDVFRKAGEMTTTMKLLTFGVLLMGVGVGCGQHDRERHRSHQTLVVESSTQPSASVPEYDSGQRTDRIEVFMREQRGPSVEAGGARSSASLDALVGRVCKVQFRRDALGQAAPAPVGPTAAGPGGRAVHLSGTIRSVGDGWLVLERDSATSYWIAQSSILLIELSDPPATQQAPR